MFFKKWYQDRVKKTNKKLYNKGYDTTAGSLLRGEETPISIPTYVYHKDWNYFYEGCYDAIERLIKAGIVEDDRYYLKRLCKEK